MGGCRLRIGEWSFRNGYSLSFLFFQFHFFWLKHLTLLLFWHCLFFYAFFMVAYGYYFSFFFFSYFWLSFLTIIIFHHSHCQNLGTWQLQQSLVGPVIEIMPSSDNPAFKVSPLCILHYMTVWQSFSSWNYITTEGHTLHNSLSDKLHLSWEHTNRHVKWRAKGKFQNWQIKTSTVVCSETLEEKRKEY